MTLAELRGRLGRSFEKMRETSKMDEMMLNSCLNEITCALLDADFPRLLVNEMERKSQEIINLPAASGKGKLIYQIILAELSSKLDPGKSALIQEKRESSIVMFIGLQGVEKTNTCAMYARFHRKKGFKPALVCADTFNLDAIVRLKKASKDEVPVYGSNTLDPAELAKLKKEKHDLIIVDTSGRHKQYSALFEEMRQLAEAVNPDLVIYVMDSSIGQAAFDQAQTFKQSFTLGVVIVTNINGNSKACGAISGVAAAKCPMILSETGEKSVEFEAFEAEPFVRRLLENPWDKPIYTLRQMHNYYREELGLKTEMFVRLVPLSCSKQDYEKIRLYTKIMDSMTDEELDKSNVKQMSEERMMEIAKASKVDVKQVVEMIQLYTTKLKWLVKFEENVAKSGKPCEPYIPRFLDD